MRIWFLPSCSLTSNPWVSSVSGNHLTFPVTLRISASQSVYADGLCSQTNRVILRGPLLHFHESAYADYHLYQRPDLKISPSLPELSKEDTASILDDNDGKRWRATHKLAGPHRRVLAAHCSERDRGDPRNTRRYESWRMTCAIAAIQEAQMNGYMCIGVPLFNTCDSTCSLPIRF